MQRKKADSDQNRQPSSRQHASQQAEMGAPPSVHQSLASEGQPLDGDSRTLMEARFGHDFSNVRVHSDSSAARSAQAVNARAYTVGPDVVFGEGQYMPRTAQGDQLLAHELAHVVQQQGGTPMTQRKRREEADTLPEETTDGSTASLKLGERNDFYEQRADTAAAYALSGRPVPGGLLSSGVSQPTVQRDPLTSAPVTPAAPTSFRPPPEVPGMMPADAQVTALNTRPLFEAVHDNTQWPQYTLKDSAWVGWDQIANLTSQTFWVGPNLANATTGEVNQTLAPEDIPFPGGTLNARIKIRATIKNVTFESADGVGVTQTSSGGGAVGSSGSVTTTNTVGATAGVSQNSPAGTPSGSGSITASSGSAAATTGTAGVSGGMQTGSAPTEGVRFKFDVDWSVTVEQKLSTGTATSILSLGIANIGAAIVEVPSQTVTATSVGGIVRFPKVRCPPEQPAAAVQFGFTRP
jgi:hypothetical protein